MPKNADIITKEYVSQNHIFADIVNYYIFRGKQKIKPEDLTDVSPIESVSVRNKTGKLTGRERIRDILKSAVVRKSGDTVYVLIGVENQTDIHYAMPVRNLMYDAINYASQVAEIASSRRKANNERLVTENKKLIYKSNEEFLSGFGENDKLIPVITITLYWGDKPWAAPRKLSDMFKKTAYNSLKYINDYSLNLIVPSEINDAEKFKSEFRLVVKALALRNDKDGFRSLMEDDEYSSVDVKTADVICELTAIKRQMAYGGKINMCKAVEEIKRDAMDEGIEKGIDQIVISMLKNNISAAEIAKMTGLSLDKIRKIEEKVLCIN